MYWSLLSNFRTFYHPQRKPRTRWQSSPILPFSQLLVAAPFHVPTAVCKHCDFFTFLSISLFLILAVSVGVRLDCIVVLICISSVINDIERLFKCLLKYIYLLAIIYIWRNVYSNSLLIFKNNFILRYNSHTIHLFKVYNSVTFSVVTELCHHYHSQF